jgi:hypothetical protein
MIELFLLISILAGIFKLGLFCAALHKAGKEMRNDQR